MDNDHSICQRLAMVLDSFRMSGAIVYTSLGV